MRGAYEVLDPAVRAVARARDTLLGEDLLQPAPAAPGGRPW
ncbi:hypothetical protein GCM10020000_52220 [Streptomyces olivoverticillatus]